MRRVLTSYFITSMLIAFPVISYADNDVYTNACNEAKYLKCMNIDKNNCLSAFVIADYTCKGVYPDVSSHNDQELNTAASAYAKCTNEQYLSYLGVDSDKFELCAAHLDVTFDKYWTDAVNQ